MEDNSGQTVQALLYRGTPDNPAFWPRALQDLPFAAAVIAAATGPSGENYVYLNRLDQFLEHASSCPTILEKFDDTFKLAAMIQTLRQDHRCRIHFLFGCGSNQHNQLLLKTADNGLVHNGDDALEFKEMVFCVTLDDEGPQGDIFDPMVDIFAGGGHSAMLSRSGRLYLCGWNDSGQLGISGGPLLESQKHASVQAAALPIPWLDALSEIRVETAALGFSHTLVVEKETGKLFAFGDNSRGQVDGTASNKDSSAMKGMLPVTPKFLQQERVTSVAAGLFHSAVILQSGELVTFGCGRFGQSLSSISDYNETTMACHGRWTPDDGSKLIRVSCGRRHTVALDDQGRVWTFGDNKYGQLGRQNAANQRDVKPGLVDVEASTYEYVGISCGWSHTIVLAKDVAAGSMRVFGWGRNDKGQLGIGSTVHQHHPVRLFELFENNIRTISCGSESTVIVDDLDMIWSCGWNEHGNLGTGGTADCLELRPVTGATITTTPGYVINDTRLAVGVGGAYVLAMRVQSNANLARSAHF